MHRFARRGYKNKTIWLFKFRTTLSEEGCKEFGHVTGSVSVFVAGVWKNCRGFLMSFLAIFPLLARDRANTMRSQKRRVSCEV